MASKGVQLIGGVGVGSESFQAIYPGTSQSVAIGAASVQSTAFNQGTSIIRLHPTVDCFVSVGANPTAVANTTVFLLGGATEYLGVNPGDKVAVIQSASSGTLYVTEGA
jgi:hypothetical protein